MYEREQLRAHLETNVCGMNKDGEHKAKDVKDNTLDAVLISSAKEFDLIAERLDQFPEWDGKTDYINLLADTIKLQNEMERALFLNILKKWLVASIGQMKRTSKNELVLILSGEQGNGKTKWFEALFKIWNGYWVSKNLNVENKDDKIMLSENVFNLWDEMTSMKRNDSESLKALLSIQDYSERKPYRRDNEQLSRIISFCGCTNDPNILRDSTGSRRFHIFETAEIDYNHNVNIEMVFSQALRLYNEKYIYWLEQDEIKETNERGRDFVGSDTNRELYFEALDKTRGDKNGKYSWMTSTAAAKCISKVLRDNSIQIDKYTATNFSKLFNSLDVEKKRIRGTNQYLLRLPYGFEANNLSKDVVYYWDERVAITEEVNKNEPPF